MREREEGGACVSVCVNVCVCARVAVTRPQRWPFPCQDKCRRHAATSALCARLRGNKPEPPRRIATVEGDFLSGNQNNFGPICSTTSNRCAEVCMRGISSALQIYFIKHYEMDLCMMQTVLLKLVCVVLKDKTKEKIDTVLYIYYKYNLY